MRNISSRQFRIYGAVDGVDRGLACRPCEVFLFADVGVLTQLLLLLKRGFCLLMFDANVGV